MGLDDATIQNLMGSATSNGANGLAATGANGQPNGATNAPGSNISALLGAALNGGSDKLGISQADATAFTQAMHLLPIFLLVSLFPVLAHWFLSGEVYWWALTGAIQALIEAMLWPLATRILLSPQRRPIDVDHNRPL
jgi:hypothetical protein